jgi:hypothetical protein
MSKPDNNMFRVTNRALANDAVLYWQAVNHRTNELTYVDHEDLNAFEREGKWIITPVLDLNKVDINGFLR